MIAAAALVAVQSLLRRDPALDVDLASALATVRDQSGAALRENDVALAYGEIEGETLRFGSLRGKAAFYPASVVKLFFLAYLEDRLASGSLSLDPELDRARRAMIVDSNNDATGLVLDAITGTTGGPSLPPPELAAWMGRRADVNRWFAARGFVGVNARQKTWNEGPYGRERQGYGDKYEFANSLTAESCLALMAGIALGTWHSAKERDEMLALLRRKPPVERTAKDAEDEQATAFTGSILPKGWGLWSKAGWTSSVRHDVALLQAPSGRRSVIVVMTRGYSDDLKLVPNLARAVLTAASPEFAGR